MALLFVYVWGITISHFHRENPERPNVNFLSVLLVSFDKLGSHPTHSSYFARSTGFLCRQLARVAKVRQFDLPACIHQQVVRFYISVHNMLAVQVGKPFKRLFQNVLY